MQIGKNTLNLPIGTSQASSCENEKCTLGNDHKAIQCHPLGCLGDHLRVGDVHTASATFGHRIKGNCDRVHCCDEHEQLEDVLADVDENDEENVAQKEVEDVVDLADHVGVCLEDVLDALKVLQTYGGQVVGKGADVGV